MSKNSQRREVFLAILFMGLGVLAVWSYCQFIAAGRAAEEAAQDLDACRHVAQQIKKLRVRPLRAALEARSSTEVAGLIEGAARTANLPIPSILQIDPQSPRRLGNSAYKEQPTHVELRDVTLKQLVAFAHSLANAEMGLDLSDLRLTAPREETARTEEIWMAEVTLTHLIYSP